jgi:inner membrane protein
MTDSTIRTGLPSRSMGLKLLVVCALALVMIIPTFFVRGLVAERMHRAEAAAGEVGGLTGGPQTFLGPVLAVPYRAPAGAAGDQPSTGVLVVFPKTGAARVATHTQVRKRSLYSVPVYTADVSYSAKFDLSGAAAAAPTGAVLDWGRAEFLIGASDAKGARSAVTLVAGGRALELAPSQLAPQMELQPPAKPAEGQADAQQTPAPEQPQQAPQPQKPQPALHLFGAPASGFAPNERSAPFEVSGTMSFSGARRVGVLAFARDTTVSIAGKWASPSFGGGVSATDREVTADGFKASWTVPFVARGVAEAGDPSLLAALGGTEMSTAFVEPANPYQSVERSLKYVLLFVGLVFLAYFIFETASSRRLHPAQYVLVGLAQIIFYLLLLSISEQLGFDAAFLIAASATVMLISLNVSWVFGGIWRFLVAFVLFSGLYGLIYVLMRLEDYALLVGAVSSFAAIALVMFFTRRIDWYGGFKLESEA